MECSSEKVENKYFNIVENCYNELDLITRKTDFISNSSLSKCESGSITPVSTELESKLNSLFLRIKTLREDIII